MYCTLLHHMLLTERDNVNASMSSLMVHLNFLKQKLAGLNCLCKIYVLHVLMMELALYILVCLIEG